MSTSSVGEGAETVQANPQSGTVRTGSGSVDGPGTHVTRS